MDWMAERNGPSVIGEVLRRVDSGVPFEGAIHELTGLEGEALQAAFNSWVRSRRSLFEVLGRMVGLWTIVSLLALVAIARGLVRRRRLLDRMEDQERTEREVQGDRGEPADEDEEEERPEG